MLRIHEVTSATDAKRYYAASDYYSEGQELVGAFGGELARRLGLSGRVDKATFERLCDNLHPFEDRSLTLRTNEQRRVGKDFVFSGPKSFSVIEALAPAEERQRLMAAFDAAITETLAEEIEPDVQVRVRKNGADSDRTTGNMLWASFDHSTARPVDARTPPDPHRHRHVLVFNATYDTAERCVKAGQFGNIKADGEYYTAAFYAKLAAKLEAMGYVIDRRGGKAWEIAGVPQSVIETFSKRTEEVEAEHRHRLEHDPDYRPEWHKHELGAKTRSGKQKELTPPQLREAWNAQLSDGEREALQAVWRKEIAPGQTVSTAEAVAYAIRHCSERQSVVPERELKREALLHGLGSMLPQAFEPEAIRQGVLRRQIGGKWMATTSELMAEEDYLVGVAAKGRGAVLPVGVAEGLERGTLNDGQWRACCGLLNSSNTVNVLEGPAGAGKSYLLAAYERGMRLAGEKVVFLATTTDAAEVLAKDGFEVNTVARFLLDEKLQAAARGCRVVVDESSLLGHKDAVRFFQLVEEKNLKPIFVGDPWQHGSVPRGALLHVLKSYAGIQPLRLDEIRRQEDPAYLAAVKQLAAGDTVAGYDALDRMGWVREIADDADRYRRLAADYVQALAEKKSVLVVSPTHKEAAAITAEIREQLRAAGKLGADEREFVRLVAANATEAERGKAATYRPGDVLVFHQHGKNGVRKGDRITVGDPARVPLAEAAKFQLYRPETIRLAEGDTVRFDGTVKTLDGKHTLKNGAVKSVAGFTEAGDIRLDNGWVVSADAGHLRHGFVATSFAAQGKTVQRVLLGMAAASSTSMNQEQMYVSASRGKERATLYTDSKDEVRSAIQASSRKLAALDLRQTPKPGLVERLKQLLERRRRRAGIERIRAAWERHGRSSPLKAPAPAPATHRERAEARQIGRDGGYGR